MGLAETLRAAGTTVIAALDNIPKTVSYYSVTIGAYDNATDSQTRVQVLRTVKGVVYKSKIETKDKNNTDLIQTKVLIAGEAFGTIVPKEDDYMVIETVKYEILSIHPAPQNAVYVFIVRAV
jgi:hypothetical protein